MRSGRICGSGGILPVGVGSRFPLTPRTSVLSAQMMSPSVSHCLRPHRGACPPALHVQRAPQPSQIQPDGLQTTLPEIVCWGPKILHEDTGPQELPQQALSATATSVRAFCGSVQPACPCTWRRLQAVMMQSTDKFHCFHPFNAGQSLLCQMGSAGPKPNPQSEILSPQLYAVST